MRKQTLGLIVLEGIFSLTSVYFAANNLMYYVNTKSIVLQSKLAKAPEVTNQVYESAREFAGSVSKGDFYMGLLNAGMAGFFGAAALYNVFRKNNQ